MRCVTLLLLATLFVSPAFASDKSDVMETVRQYNADFNKGDVQSMVALCTSQTLIIDDFAPYSWQGANTCAEWAAALAATDKASGISNEAVTLGKPWHVSVTADRAYAVYPTHYRYKLNGKRVTERGVWTFALQKLTEGWRIAGWAWAQR